MTTLREAAQRLVDHADFQLGGILSADSKARDIPSKAVSQVKARHLAALRQALAQPESEPASDREALIAGLKSELANFAHNKTLETLLLDSVDMLEADGQEITALHLEIDELHSRMKAQQVAVPQELVPVAKRDTLRTRLNIIMGQINQLEWKTGVGGSYFETVQEQCDAIVKDFGLKRLSSHLMSLPHTWVRRNTGLTDGYEIIEPRGCYVPANQAQQVAVPPGVAAWEYENERGDKFLTFNDPSNWHGHDKHGFKNFRGLQYAAPQPAYVPLTQPESEPSDREALIAQARDYADSLGVVMQDQAAEWIITLCDMLEADGQQVAVPQSSNISAEMLAFLNGSGPLDGVWFGEDHPTEWGAFWWRKHLSAVPQPAQEQEAAPQEPNNNEVICPNCCTQFRAIPVNVQRLMLDVGFEPPFMAAPQPAYVPLSDAEITRLWMRAESTLGGTVEAFTRLVEQAVRGKT